MTVGETIALDRWEVYRRANRRRVRKLAVAALTDDLQTALEGRLYKIVGD